MENLRQHVCELAEIILRFAEAVISQAHFNNIRPPERYKAELRIAA